jgi:hypothetical protein
MNRGLIRGLIRCRGTVFVRFEAFRLALRPTLDPTQWVLGTLSPEVRQMGREVDHSRASSTEV